MQGLINAAAIFSNSDAEGYFCCPPEGVEDTQAAKTKILFQAAQILKTDVKRNAGICIQPLSVDDISLKSGRQVFFAGLFRNGIIMRTSMKKLAALMKTMKGEF